MADGRPIEEGDPDETTGRSAIPLAGHDRGRIQSIDRAANILALFDQDTRSLTPVIVSERLGLNRTTAHRYLQSLHSSGFLSSTYGPGPLLDQLSALVSTRQQIVTLAPAVMRHLSDQTGLTAVLSFLGRSGAVVTLVEEAQDGTIVLTVRIGTVLEPKAAQSRILFAFQSDPAVIARALSALPPAEARAEQVELARVRRERIAWADLKRTGLASVAAPVFGSHEVQAAMGLLGTTAMLASSDDGARRVQLLGEAADELSSLVAP